MTQKRIVHIPLAEFKHTSILHYLLDKNIIVHFSCADGFCGVCHSLLLSGKIHFVKDQIGWKPSQEFLLCCAVPETDISVEIY